jgi:hypothetical protein
MAILADPMTLFHVATMPMAIPLAALLLFRYAAVALRLTNERLVV